MMRRALLCAIAATAGCVLAAQARDVRDTLFSTTGDRVILDYSVAQSGGQLTVKFAGVQKKLSQRNLDKYKKLDEIAVVFFDRTGTYNDMKFEGIATNAFMVPAGMSYTSSEDGYFLLQDNPVLKFTAGADATVQIPLYLAHYRKKQTYDVFAQLGTLQLDAAPGAAAQQQGRQGGTEVITSEELLDEGLAPADEALIRIGVVKGMLDKATKAPFSEELTQEAAALRELRYRVTDPAVGAQIGAVLDAYDEKKQQLEQQAEAAAEQAAAQQAAAQQAEQQAAQARQDSIQAAQAEQASQDKKDMMWLIGGIAGLGLLLMVGKQVFQTMKNNKLQKAMMDNISKAQQQAMANINIPGAESNPLLNSLNNEVKREARKTMTKEGEAAKEKLQALRRGNKPAADAAKTAAAPQATAPAAAKRPSLNDQIPAKYKRWRKPGQSDNNNVKI